jgi:hypothetical protein
MAIKEIDAICRKFLWVGKDESINGKCLVTWKTVCRPTELGGLGITDLRLAGYALQSRWLWLQKTDSVRAWSELPLNMDSEDQAFFRASTFTEVGAAPTPCSGMTAGLTKQHHLTWPPTWCA